MRIRWSCDGTVVPGTNASQHNYEKGFWHPQVLNEAITLMHLLCHSNPSMYYNLSLYILLANRDVQ